MDPDSVKSTFSNLAMGNVMAAAARNLQKEMLAQEKTQAPSSANDEVDLDELMDDPELEKLHAERIAALKKEAEKRQKLKTQGHGEYREITEGDFLGEVTGSELVICHFYHREFYRCKMPPSLYPSSESKLCHVLYYSGIAVDRVVGFEDLGGKDDFSTRTLENLLSKKGIINAKKRDEDEEDDYSESKRTSVRSSLNLDSDSD